MKLLENILDRFWPVSGFLSDVCEHLSTDIDCADWSAERPISGGIILTAGFNSGLPYGVVVSMKPLDFKPALACAFDDEPPKLNWRERHQLGRAIATWVGYEQFLRGIQEPLRPDPHFKDLSAL